MKYRGVAVIIPAYNRAEKLDYCLKTVRAQTYTNLQIIVVDDGSTDDTLRVALTHALDDPRIVVTTIEHAGASSARNYGIDLVETEFLTFVDSDDIITESFIEGMVEHSEGYDLIIAGRTIFRSEEAFLANDGQALTGFYDGSALGIGTETDYDRNLFSILIGGIGWKLYRTQIIRDSDLKFPCDLDYGEDAAFSLSYLKYCDRVCAYPDPGYYYRFYGERRLSDGLTRPKLIKSLGKMVRIVKQTWGTPLAHPLLLRWEDWLADEYIVQINASMGEDLVDETNRVWFYALSEAADIAHMNPDIIRKDPLLRAARHALDIHQFWPIQRGVNRRWADIDAEHQSKACIVIRAYGDNNECAALIESVQAQTYDNLQIIVVDDGTCVAAQNVLDEVTLWDKRVEWLWSTEYSGHIDAQIAQRAQSDYIVTLPDVTPAPNLVEKVMQLVADNEGATTRLADSISAHKNSGMIEQENGDPSDVETLEAALIEALDGAELSIRTKNGWATVI